MSYVFEVEKGSSVDWIDLLKGEVAVEDDSKVEDLWGRRDGVVDGEAIVFEEHICLLLSSWHTTLLCGSKGCSLFYIFIYIVFLHWILNCIR